MIVNAKSSNIRSFSICLFLAKGVYLVRPHEHGSRAQWQEILELFSRRSGIPSAEAFSRGNASRKIDGFDRLRDLTGKGFVISLKLTADSALKLSVDPGLCARSLRAIGQDLADLYPEKLEIEMTGDDFVARGYGLDNRFAARDADENILTKIWKKIARDDRMADRVCPRSSIVPFVRTYTPADIDRLDELAGSRRDSRNKGAPDLYALGERLRTIGRIADADHGKLIKLCKDGHTLTFDYEGRKGQTHSLNLSNLTLNQIQGRYRSQRWTGEQKDIWKGMDL